MKKVYLLAHPAGHSLSPKMHNAAFKHLGIDASYQAWDVAPEALRQALITLRQPDVYGANVTVPHKVAVFERVDTLTDAAKAIGAVNTVINDNGSLKGHNTDAEGFLKALREDASFDPQGKRAVMLGAGGSARAVAYALLRAGVAQLSIYNRTVQKAHDLEVGFRSLGPVSVLSQLELEDAVQGADLLINTTSVGMARGGVDPNQSPLKAGILPQRGLVCDLIYRPARTRLLRDAEQAGLKIQNGLAMLVYQGAESLTCWTGREAPIKTMFASARSALGETST